ncbi:MAG: LLM class flavin-dependent oxidoreductase [Solirubrobacteraceae bacterium]
MSEPFVGVRPPGWLGADPAADVQQTLEWAQQAERLGFELLFVGDRLLGSAHSETGMPVYEAAMLDPFVLLSAIAARTSRLRLATLVAVLPFRHPASMAKLVVSLDVLSEGRFVLGAGSGWSDPELKMFGVQRRTRGAQMEESIEILRELFKGEPTTCDGRFWQLEDVVMAPRPIQPGGPPVWLASFAPDDAVTWSGEMSPAQRRALERVGRIADGWVPLTYSAGHKCQLAAEQLEEGWRIIEGAARQAGRDPDAIELIYPHWIAVVRDEPERRACEAGLARYFSGSYEDAQATYLIGTPEEIAQRIRDHTAGLPRVDGYLLTPIVQTGAHLEAIASELRPLLRRR